VPKTFRGSLLEEHVKAFMRKFFEIKVFVNSSKRLFLNVLCLIWKNLRGKRISIDNRDYYNVNYLYLAREIFNTPMVSMTTCLKGHD